MSEIDDGGPAFPGAKTDFVPDVMGGRQAIAEISGGMSLRDWFAGQALTGVLTTATGLGGSSKAERAELFGEVSGIIYELADAMLAARAAKKEAE